MNKFVKAWLGSLPKYQANIVEEYVRDKQARGDLLTKEEFNSFYKSLINRVEDTFGSPLFKTVNTDFDEIADSDTHNYLVKNLRLDINALYRELDAIYNATLSHRQHVEENLIPAFDGHVNDITNLLTTYELLAGNSNGYNRIEINDFKSNNSRSNRGDFIENPLSDKATNVEYSSDIFTDPKTGAAFGPEYDCAIDESAGVLILPVNLDDSNSVRIVDVIFEEGKSTIGNFISNYGTSPANILIEQPWRLDNYFFWKPTTDVLVALTIFFGGISKINQLSFIPIEDVSSLQIDHIEAIDISGTSFSLIPTNPELLNVGLTSKATFFFKEFYAKGVTFYLKQLSAKTIQIPGEINNSSEQLKAEYNYGYSSANYTNATNLNKTSGTMFGGAKSKLVGAASLKIPLKKKSMYQYVEKGMKTGDSITYKAPEKKAWLYPTISCPLLPSGAVDSYVYSFGCAGVEAAFTAYQDLGIYVSKKATTNLLSGLSLSSTYNVPVGSNYPVEPVCGLEWQIAKYDYDIESNLLGSTRFYILPADEVFVQREKLYPDGDGLARLSFPATIDLGLPSGSFENDITIYFNGLTLTAGTDWEIVEDSSSDYATIIRLLGQYVPTHSAGYVDMVTASYTPAFLYAEHGTNLTDIGWTAQKLYDSETGSLKKFYIDTDNTIWYTQYNTIEHNPSTIGRPVQSSSLYIIITMRALSLDNTITPVVDSYRMMMGELSSV